MNCSSIMLCSFSRIFCSIFCFFYYSICQFRCSAYSFLYSCNLYFSYFFIIRIYSFSCWACYSLLSFNYCYLSMASRWFCSDILCSNLIYYNFSYFALLFSFASINFSCCSFFISSAWSSLWYIFSSMASFWSWSAFSRFCALISNFLWVFFYLIIFLSILSFFFSSLRD